MISVRKHLRRHRNLPVARPVRELAPSTIRTLTNEEAAYLAGIIDGEGSIDIRGNKVIIYVGNTDIDMMRWLQQIGANVYEVRATSSISRKRFYTWNVTRRADVRAVLRRVLPYLIIKREKAIRAMEVL